MEDGLIRRIAGAVVDDPANGIFRCRRDVFTDPELFELEMKFIFESNWVYLAHESQIENKHDYLSLCIGRTPVILNRAKDASSGAYPESFDNDGSHDLTRVRVESYRGFIFGSLNHDVLPLADHLGEARVIIDQMVDQAPEVTIYCYAPKGESAEDRAHRIRQYENFFNVSGMGTPEARTAHFIANVELLAVADGTLDLRYNWHTLSHRYQRTAQFFGTTFLTLDTRGAEPKILKKKKIVLKDDYIHQVIDIYHV